MATFRATLKIVNPLGTVTTINDDLETFSNHNISQLHENCDETLFRPFVTVINDNNNACRENEEVKTREISNTNVLQNAKLIVPIYNEVNVTKNKSSVSKTSNSNYKKYEPKKQTLLKESVTKDFSKLKLNEAQKNQTVEESKPVTLESTVATVSTQNTGSRKEKQKKKIEVFEECTENSYRNNKIQEDLLKSDVEIVNKQKEVEKETEILLTKNDSIEDISIEVTHDKFSLDLKFPSLEPLDPLDNFVDTFDKTTILDATHETEKQENIFDAPPETVWNNLNQKKLIFAMCSSLKDDNNDLNQPSSNAVETHESQDSDYKSLETEESTKMHETEGDSGESPRSDDTTSSGSDDNTEENSGVLSDLAKQQEDDDEELRPLIKSSVKSDDSKHDDTPSTDLSCNVNDVSSVQSTPVANNNKRKSRKKRR